MFPIDRRLSLKCTVGAFCSLLEVLPSWAAAASTPEGGSRTVHINWDQFIDKIGTLAESHSRGALPSAAFVRDAAKAGVRLDARDKVLAAGCNFIRKRQASVQSPFMLAEVNRHITFDILLLSLEPGYTIPLHDHPDRSGISVCLNGQAQVSNYDLSTTSTGLKLKLRSRATIGPAQAGTLTEADGNIHTITAIQRTQIIDVISPPAPPSGGFHWYRAEPESHSPTVLRVTSVL